MSLVESTKPKEALEEIQKLQGSLGWALIKEFVERDILHAIYEIGDNPTMTEGEVHYRRGMIKSTQNFTDLPRKLEMYFENQLRLDIKE